MVWVTPPFPPAGRMASPFSRILYGLPRWCGDLAGSAGEQMNVPIEQTTALLRRPSVPRPIWAL